MSPARQGARGSRPGALLAAAASAIGATWWLKAPQPQCFTGLALQSQAPASSVARAAEGELPPFITEKPMFRGCAQYQTYDGYVHRKKRMGGLRIKMARFGVAHSPFYKIFADFRGQRKKETGKFIEQIGYWDPMREVSDPKFMRIKADRAAYWLRKGAMPTDMVASLFDRAGLIRRTGPDSKKGEWEWRISKQSGPDTPAGWSYDGPHRVDWNNKPEINWKYVRHMQEKFAGERFEEDNKRDLEAIPLIERYGFRGYVKIPLDEEVAREPLTKTGLFKAFDNVNLPGY